MLQENFLIAVVFVLLIIAALAALAVYKLWRKTGSDAEDIEDIKEDMKFKALEESMKQALLMLQNQMQEMSRTFDTKYGDINKMMISQHEAISRSKEDTLKIVRDFTGKLTEYGETNKQVVNFTEQLKNLQDILKNPKQRGILGEYYLETVLKNVLPPGAYKMQYSFNDGAIVDAAIFVKKQIIPVDSKFSLENYNKLTGADGAEKKQAEDSLRQDLKIRIDETSKYIRPEEGTMGFAFMFIPSEALYYDLLINKVGAINARDLVEYAIREKKVIIVSPTSFLAYLQTVLQGLRGMEIEESAKDIIKRVGELQKHMLNYETFLKKLGANLATTVNMYNSAYKEFGKMDKDVVRITGGERQTEPLELEKPIME